MVVEFSRLEVDASRLEKKIELLRQDLFSSRITTGQLRRLIQSVYIQPELNTERDCMTLYVDMLEPSDTRQPH